MVFYTPISYYFKSVRKNLELFRLEIKFNTCEIDFLFFGKIFGSTI